MAALADGGGCGLETWAVDHWREPSKQMPKWGWWIPRTREMYDVDKYEVWTMGTIDACMWKCVWESEGLLVREEQKCQRDAFVPLPLYVNPCMCHWTCQAKILVSIIASLGRVQIGIRDIPIEILTKSAKCALYQVNNQDQNEFRTVDTWF